MNPFPEDIFTEQDGDPDTLANLGPLRRLAGVWEGRKGVDLNPKADGPERREANSPGDDQDVVSFGGLDGPTRAEGTPHANLLARRATYQSVGCLPN